jgi:hypothetical protein
VLAARTRGEEVGSYCVEGRRGSGALSWMLRAREVGGPMADSDDWVGSTDALVSEWERRRQHSLMEGKERVAAGLRLLHGVRGGRWPDA